MELFNVSADVEQQEEKDTLGFAARNSAFYGMTIKAAFLGDYPKGSKYLQVVLQDEDGGTYTEEECVWSITTKGPTYIDKKSGKSKELIGFARMNSLAKMLTGKGLNASTFETKVHEVYSKEAGAKVPTPLPTLTEWAGKKVHVGILKTIENKQKKVGEEYKPTAETREVNHIDKWFNEDKQTAVELAKGKPAKFFEDWTKANTDRVIDKTDKTLKSGPVGGAVGAQAAPLQFDE